MPLETGARLGPYEIQELLGVGGMGEVYRGRDTRLGRDVALKVIAPRLADDPAFRRRFEMEARAASALNHPAIVTVYDVGDSDGVSWIAMEWVEGRTLRQALSDGPLQIRDAASIARQIAEGLAAAHGKGVVHRDLKPENVMLAGDGRTKILDFGLARQTLVDTLEGSSNTVTAPPSAPTFAGAILGTVGYMSPEQASGRTVDFRSDQFALGLIAYEMLAGQRAFERPTAVETLTAIIREEPVPLDSVRAGIPEALQSLVARCLAKRPDARFASTRELATALEYLGAGGSSHSVPVLTQVPTPTTNPTRPPPAVARTRWARAAMVALGVLVVLGIGIAGWTMFVASRGAIASLAVLPFQNTSRDPDIDYLGDGLTESLIEQMTRVPSLKVMARGTVFRFKGTMDPQAAGRLLRVGAVLTGTVARSRRAGHLVISAELIEIPSGNRLWGQTYDRPAAELLSVQDTIASDIAGGLRLRLSAPEAQTLAQHGTRDPEAYELLLKARALMRTQSEGDDLEARRLFLLAIERDPKFLDAHLGVASTYARRAGNGSGPPAEAWARADEHIRKALAIDPTSVQARAARANRRFLYEWNWVGAEQEFREVSADPRLFLGPQFHPIPFFFWARGDTGESVALMERALRVDPGNMESRSMLADFLAHAGRLEDAIDGYRTLVRDDPQNPGPLFGLADVLKRRGDLTGALEALHKAYELRGEDEAAEALAKARTEQDYEKVEISVARSYLLDLEAAAKHEYVSPLDIARLQAQVGEREKAFVNLAAAVAERSPMLVLLKVDRAWDRIRDDPRFAAVVRTVGIP